MFLQSYSEGSHYSEHDGLSSPFLSSGIGGGFYFLFSSERICVSLHVCLSDAEAEILP